MDASVNEKVKPLSKLWRLRSVLDALPLAYARNNNATVKIHPLDSEVSYFGWYIHRSLLSVFQSAVEEVNRRNVQSMVSQMPIDPVNPILVIVVKRENIVDHTLNQIMKCGPYDLKKPLKVIGSFSNLAINLNDKNNLLTMHARVRDKTRKDWMRLPVFKSLDLRAPTSLLLNMVLLKLWMILRTKVIYALAISKLWVTMIRWCGIISASSGSRFCKYFLVKFKHCN